jgi:Rps23 Pro-64 3,4-dihydroxylase Tpa1-like proline 4-hydroxylase
MKNIIINSIDLKKASLEFKRSDSFDHIVIDNFLKEDFALKLARSFPSPSQQKWWSYKNQLEKKLAFNDIEKLDPCFQDFFIEVNSDNFTNFLAELSGIEKLFSDPSLNGGGLHLIKRGGKLDVHEDFNIHRGLGMLRTLNLIVYLNEGWKEEWGGHLELWDATMTTKSKSVLPVFNRAVIFRTDMNSNHGHPHPLECPEDRYRISLATYYYRQVEDIERIPYRSTTYKKLPGVDDGFDELRRLRQLGRLRDEVE